MVLAGAGLGCPTQSVFKETGFGKEETTSPVK